MIPDERKTIVGNAYLEYWAAKQAMAALEASCEAIATTSSLTTADGYWMYSHAVARLYDTDYVKEQVAQYHVAQRHKEALRRRLIELGEPDPETP
jgi:hypothetical protein